MKLRHVLETISFWGDENDSSPRAQEHPVSIKVKCPVFKVDGCRWGLGFCPLGDEVDECLGLDGSQGGLGDGKHHQLHCPIGIPPDGVLIVDEVGQREGADHRDRMPWK